MDFDLLNKSFLDIIDGDIERELVIENIDWVKRCYNYFDSENKIAYDITIWFSLYWGIKDEKHIQENLERLDSFLKFDSQYKKSKYSKVNRIIRIFAFENKELFRLMDKHEIEYMVIKK